MKWKWRLPERPPEFHENFMRKYFLAEWIFGRKSNFCTKQKCNKSYLLKNIFWPEFSLAENWLDQYKIFNLRICLENIFGKLLLKLNKNHQKSIFSWKIIFFVDDYFFLISKLERTLCGRVMHIIWYIYEILCIKNVICFCLNTIIYL